MTYHEWGDDFDFKSLDEAGYYIQDRCRQFGRVGIWVKEKYGTLRVSTTCAFINEHDFLHNLIYPGHAYIRWPRWFRVYVDWKLGWLMGKLGIVRVIQWYQIKVLKFFWKRAAKKWPLVKNEIMCEYNMYFGDNND